MTRYPGESPEYRAARDQLLEQEVRLRREMEAVAEARRSLPPGGVVPEDTGDGAVGSLERTVRVRIVLDAAAAAGNADALFPGEPRSVTFCHRISSVSNCCRTPLSCAPPMMIFELAS